MLSRARAGIALARPRWRSPRPLRPLSPTTAHARAPRSRLRPPRPRPARTLQARRYDSQTTTFSPEGARRPVRPPRAADAPYNTPRRRFTRTASLARNPPSPRPALRCAPAGRLYQVEYAIAAIQNAAAAVGLQTKGGIVIATEKRVASKLLAPSKTSEKVYKIDEHVRASCAAAAAARGLGRGGGAPP